MWPKAAVIPGHATAEVPECMSCHQVSQSVQAQCSLTTETKGLLHVCNDLQHQQDSRIMQKRDLQKFGPGEHKPGIVFFRIWVSSYLATYKKMNCFTPFLHIWFDLNMCCILSLKKSISIFLVFKCFSRLAISFSDLIVFQI